MARESGVGRALLPAWNVGTGRSAHPTGVSAWTGRSAHPAIIAFFLLLLMVAPVYGRWQPQPLPSLIRNGDVMIWDEQYLGGHQPKGGKASGGFLEVFERYGPMVNEFRHGRFGLFSGSRLHTTFRYIKPLSDDIYAVGKTANFDTHVSELVTSPFEVKLGYVTFLLSGGNMPNEACINLLIDGKVVRTATGRNDDKLEWVAFDVKAFKGQQAQVQVLDTSTAAFGYITFDCICQSPDTKGAVRVIARPPSNTQKTTGRVETTSGRLEGKPDVANGRLTLGGRAVDLKDLLLLDTGIESAGDPSGKRVELVNGDVLPAEVRGLDEEKLAIEHGLFGEIEVALADLIPVSSRSRSFKSTARPFSVSRPFAISGFPARRPERVSAWPAVG